jgi:hypothetical protein
MPSYFTYEKSSGDKEFNRIGGNSLLPKFINWPIDKSGRKMLFLASLSPEIIQSECGIYIPEGNIISIFLPYKKGSIEHAIDIARQRDRGYIISHPPGELRQECEYPIIEGRQINLNKDFETDEDEFSEDIEDKIGGDPNWLQDRFDYSGHEFLMQISGLYFGTVFPDHKDLFMGGIFYAFYNSAKNDGLVLLQYS